ncbi:hypothetical protein [Streptomyces sp. NPDC056682]|uniref:hypothetical protein n=1 Tax=Streptomyces sp. NPDC056682 TaxID=3345909 RepID=UPI003684A5B3
MSQPIEPTRVIPSGVHIPTLLSAAPPPPPPPPPPPAWYALPDPPPPGPLDVRVTVDLVYPTPEPEPVPPPRDWSWLWQWVRPVQTVLTAGIAAVPLLPGGRSLITAWADTLHQCRMEASTGGAYVLAGVGAGLAFLLDRSRRWWARTLLVATIVGATGAMDWYDAITAVTGVTR